MLRPITCLMHRRSWMPAASPRASRRSSGGKGGSTQELIEFCRKSVLHGEDVLQGRSVLASIHTNQKLARGRTREARVGEDHFTGLGLRSSAALTLIRTFCLCHESARLSSPPNPRCSGRAASGAPLRVSDEDQRPKRDPTDAKVLRCCYTVNLWDNGQRVEENRVRRWLQIGVLGVVAVLSEAALAAQPADALPPASNSLDEAAALASRISPWPVCTRSIPTRSPTSC